MDYEESFDTTGKFRQRYQHFKEECLPYIEVVSDGNDYLMRVGYKVKYSVNTLNLISSGYIDMEPIVILPEYFNMVDEIAEGNFYTEVGDDS